MTYEEIRHRIETGYYEVSSDDINLQDYIDDHQSKQLRIDISKIRNILSNLFTSDLYAYEKYYNNRYNLLQHKSFITCSSRYIPDKLKRLNDLQRSLENERRKLLSA